MRRFKNLYFLPVSILVPVKGWNETSIAYHKHRNKPFTKHMFWCVAGAYDGMFEGVWLGLLWPIGAVIAIKRYIDKN